MPIAVQNLRKLEFQSIYYGLAEINHHDHQRDIDLYGQDDGAESEDDQETDLANKYGSTPMMIQLATLLEDLTLTFLDDYRDHRQAYCTPYIPLSHLKGTNPMQHLERLKLGNLKLEEPQLIKFILSLSSLKHLTLDGIVLDPGTWTSTFTKLKGRLAGLERLMVDFHGIWDADIEVGEDGPYDWRYNCREKYCDWNEHHHLAWFKEGKGEHPLKSLIERRLVRENKCNEY